MSDSAPHPDAAPAPLPSTPVPVPQAVGREGVIPFDSARPPALPTQEAGFFSGLALDEPEGARTRSIPILGGLAAIFGIAALFNTPIVLGPLALVFGLAALCRRQVSLGVIGGVAGLVALLISPVFWALLGLGWLAGWLLG
jgi:hypothetical protein